MHLLQGFNLPTHLTAPCSCSPSITTSILWNDHRKRATRGTIIYFSSLKLFISLSIYLITPYQCLLIEFQYYFQEIVIKMQNITLLHCYQCQEAYVRSKLMLGGASEDQQEALSQAKTAQIQGVMKLFAVSLWFTCQHINQFMRGKSSLIIRFESLMYFFLKFSWHARVIESSVQLNCVNYYQMPIL